MGDREAQLVPVGKALTEHNIATSPFATGMIFQDAETKEWKLNEDKKPSAEMTRKGHELAHEFLVRSLKMIAAERALSKVRTEAHSAVGGKVVFVDLAGNEWGA